MANKKNKTNSVHVNDSPPEKQSKQHESSTAETLEISSISVGGKRALQSHAFPFLPGDRYRIEVYLGSGGMGDVYKAYDHQLKRFVALKFLRSEDPLDLQRFTREAQTQAKIEYPNVCKVFDIGRTRDRAYLCMQYIEGRTLDEVARSMNLQEKIRVSLTVVGREQRLKEVKETYLKPAIRMLIETRAGGAAYPFYLEALLNSVSKRYTRALALTEKALKTDPYAYEAMLLKAEILKQKAVEATSFGDEEHAQQSYEESLASVDGARAIARSDPTVYLTGCQIRQSQLRFLINTKK